jgi:glycosyltransferase involved in cell wall biosynthesis
MPGERFTPPGAPLVLHVLEALEGGTARHLADVVTRVAGVRHAVVVPPRRSAGVTDTAAVAAMEAAGVPVHRVPMRRAAADPVNAAAVARVGRLVADLGPDVVHGHSSVGGAVARLAAWRSPAARVYTPNGLARGRLALQIERALGRRTDVLVAVSPSEADLAVAHGLVPAERVTVIPNGIDPDPPTGAGAPDLRVLTGVAPGTPLVGCVARLVPQKAPEDFVRTAALVAARHPAAHFVLIGTGPLQGAVDREVDAAGLWGRFHQIRFLPNAAASVGQLDVFVLPSRFEGAPYTLLEAMRAGVPVVATDVVGNRDAVAHGTSGLLVAPGDVAGLAAAVGRLLDDPALAARLGRGGQALVRERFTLAAMAAALGELYARLAAGPRSASRKRPATTLHA